MELTGERPGAGLLFAAYPPLSPAGATVAIAATCSLIFALDRVTGAAPVQHLYYLPIVFAAVRFGGRGGLSAAVLSIIFYHLANSLGWTLHYQESDVLQMTVFVAVGLTAGKLASDSRRFHQLAMTDDLTGLHNLRSFETRLKSMVLAAREKTTPLSLLVLDLDRLKSLNDVHGHLVGAEAVRAVGRILAAVLPPEAVACRYGGDEFVIALPERDRVEAIGVAEDLVGAVNALAPVLADVSFPRSTLSISVGVACRAFEPLATNDAAFDGNAAGEALFREADLALYAAKQRGRNRVSAAG